MSSSGSDKSGNEMEASLLVLATAASRSSDRGGDNYEGKEDEDVAGAASAPASSLSTYAARARKKVKRDIAGQMMTGNDDDDDVMARKMPSSDNGDHLLKTCQALIATNNEIWQRCSVTNWGFTYTAEGDCNSSIFTRAAYTTVQVMSGKSRIRVSAKVAWSKKYFGPPPGIPRDLKRFLPSYFFRTRDYGDEDHDDNEEDGSAAFNSVLLDYQHLLDGAVGLYHDEHIAAVLAKLLKEHLADMQVYLGQVDSWLMEPVEDTAFISELFEKELQYPLVGCKKSTTPVSEEDSCPVDQHLRNSICLLCGKHGWHHTGHACPYYRHVVAADGDEESGDEEENETQSDEEEYEASFVRRTIRLREFVQPSEDKSAYDLTYDLQNAEHKEKLRNLTDFLTSSFELLEDTPAENNATASNNNKTLNN